MDKNQMMLIFLAVCAVLFFISFFRKKMEVFINFLLRAVFGVIGIYFMNEALLAASITSGVGINLVSASVSGVFGISGIALLYAVTFYKNI